MRKLEDATGRPLFTRDTHSVELTEDGEAMLGFARRILQVHEQATAFFTGTRLRGRLRFGASEDFVLTRLPEILERFRDYHPEVDLELTVELSGTLHEHLAAGSWTWCWPSGGRRTGGASWSGTTGWCGSAPRRCAWTRPVRCR
ncbi:LysR family transcriptional regulator OS=Streptomyces fumanus OX=67302 GN=GCM10018772_58750 PE=3 SV=1 [Streptomyces fumanus]